MLKLGWAAGMAFRKQGKCRILIGKDTRISGYMFESALEAGLAAAGADVQLLGPMPTPAIAYLTRTFQADAGIVISASHNPHDDNGIKFFSSEGTKLPDDVEMMIEELLDQPMTVVESAGIGKASRINDASGRYIEFCKGSVPSGTSFKGLKIVIDCAHGAAYRWRPACSASWVPKCGSSRRSPMASTSTMAVVPLISRRCRPRSWRSRPISASPSTVMPTAC